jgi:Tfp pilus assembly protein PilV
VPPHPVLATRYSVLQREAGFSLVELMMAVLILTFGLLAITALFATAIGNNGRSRVDSTATMLSESVLEQITAVLANGGPSSLTDSDPQYAAENCPAPTTWYIDTNVGGASLSGATIDFTQAQSAIPQPNPPYTYYMNYVVCNGAGEFGTTAVYDVRWNIAQLSASSYLVTVAARPQGMVTGRFTFALPVTMRMYVGPQ